jgi:hypothetical protein
MLLALLLSLTQSPPPIKVEINHDRFAPGDQARIYVQTERDGYLMVLHADPSGRVRVLFPLDPTDDDFIRGGRKVEIRGRGDRDAFVVDDDDGTGTVIAAVSADPFKYDDFTRNGHWDYRVLRDASTRNDPLTGLLDLADSMASGAHYDYDEVTYYVTRHVVSRYSSYGYGYDDFWYPYHYGFGLGIGFGYPFGYGYPYGFYNPFYNPFCFNTFWGWTPRCAGFGFGFTSFRPRRYIFYRPRPYVFGRPVVFVGFGSVARVTPHFVIPQSRQSRPRVVAVEPRGRGALIDRQSYRVATPNARLRGVDQPRPVEMPRIEPRVRDFGREFGGWSRASGGSEGSRSISRPSGPRESAGSGRSFGGGRSGSSFGGGRVSGGGGRSGGGGGRRN